jgi:hypothetical protein
MVTFRAGGNSGHRRHAAAITGSSAGADDDKQDCDAEKVCAGDST